MSGYARAAHALGAEVSGSDARRAARTSSALARRRRAARERSATRPRTCRRATASRSSTPRRVPAENAERAAARERGLPERPRAELLGELSALRRTIAVAGTHGKTTTASMLVHALRAAGLEPGWLVGGAGRRRAAERATGARASGSSSRPTSPTARCSASTSRSRVLTNVELDHHATFASLAELREAFREFLAGAAQAVVWDRPELLELRGGRGRRLRRARRSSCSPAARAFAGAAQEVALRGPRRAQRAQRRRGARGGAAGRRRRGARRSPALAGVRRRRPALPAARRTAPAGALVYDDYAHHPTEVAATLRGARTLAHRAAGRGLPAAPVLAHGAARARVRRARWRSPTWSWCSTSTRRASAPRTIRASAGCSIAEAAADAARGRPVYWLPTFADAEPVAARAARRGRPVRGDGRRRRRRARARVLGGGAMSARSARSSSLRSPPECPARLPARAPDDRAHGRRGEFFARAGNEARAARAARVGARRERSVERRRLGLEPADRRRGRARARAQARPRARADRARRRADRLRRRRAAAGGRRARRARGPLGDRVRRQHPGHRRRRGADERERLRRRARARARVGRDRDGERRRAARARAARLRLPQLEPRARARSWRARRFALAEPDPASVKATLAEMRARRHEAQPQGIKTFGSTFKNPEDPRAEGRSAGLLLAEAGCNGLHGRRRALRAEARELHREHRRGEHRRRRRA